MFQILSIRTGAFILTSFRIVCIILFLVCLSIGTLKVVRLEAQIQERQRQIKDGNNDYVNAMEQGDYFCGTSVLPCTQVYHTIQKLRRKCITYIFVNQFLYKKEFYSINS